MEDQKNKENLNIEEGKDKKKKTGKKILKITVEWIIYVVIFVVIVWGTPAGLQKILKTDYPIASITSSSMWPVLKQDDLVLIKGVSSKEEIAVGDIVVYLNRGPNLASEQASFTIHRVVRMNGDTFTTKGDANNIEDKPAEYGSLIGKTLNFKNKPVRIPNLGKLSRVFNK